jgi:hypothetical protein
MKSARHACGLSIVLLTTILAGCAEKPVPNPTLEFLKNARDETAAIPATKDRFRRQLNVANAQITNYEHAEARQTLALAEVTLRSAKPGELDDRTTLAGWVSLSELYRQAMDEDAQKKHPEQIAVASSALDQAIGRLHQIEPESLRTYYVRAIAREISDTRTLDAASSALTEAGAWADQIKAQAERRRAYRGLARDLLGDQDFLAATAMLRRDPDPAWRTDAAVMLTTSPRQYAYARGLEFNSPAEPAPLVAGSLFDQIPFLKRLTGNTSADQAGDDFGVPLDYQSNFGEDAQTQQQSGPQQ